MNTVQSVEAKSTNCAAKIGDVSSPSTACISHFADITPEWGALDGEECSEEQYWLIPLDFGRYELVRGILKSLEMSDGQSSTGECSFIGVFNTQLRNGKISGFSARAQGRVRLQTRTIRVPDFVVGYTEAIGRELGSAVFDYQKSDVMGDRWAPQLVVEITSGNRENDMVGKRKDYALAGVRRYWIIDRKCNVVRDLRLQNGTYIETVKEIGDFIYSKFLGRLSVRSLLQPRSPGRREERAGARQRKERQLLISGARRAKSQRDDAVREQQRQAARADRATQEQQRQAARADRATQEQQRQAARADRATRERDEAIRRNEEHVQEILRLQALLSTRNGRSPPRRRQRRD